MFQCFIGDAYEEDRSFWSRLFPLSIMPIILALSQSLGKCVSFSELLYK